MTTVITMTVYTVAVVLLAYSVCLMHRNNAVYKMRQRANEACFRYEMALINSCKTDKELRQFAAELDNIRKTTDAIRHRNSYNDMVYSFRPVRIEKWYTETECEIIKKYGYED